MYAVSRVAVARPERVLDAPGFLLETIEQLRSRFEYDGDAVAEELGVQGRFAIVSRWSSLAARADAATRIMQDPWFAEMWGRASEMFQPGGQDVVSMTLDGSPMPALSPISSFRSAVARNGHLREAATFAMDIAADASSAIGLHVVPMTMRTGQANTFGWIAGADSMAELEASYTRFMADETMAKSIDEAGEMWIDGSTMDSYWRRIG